MIYFERGGMEMSLSGEDLKAGLFDAFKRLGSRKRVLAVPPDVTRFASRAGEMTRIAAEFYGKALTDILPALGTHAAMTEVEIQRMFGDLPRKLFRIHDWRTGVRTLGEVPAEFVRTVSEGSVDYSWPAQVDVLLAEGKHDLILSFGQVVPHEVIGMANYNKNIFVGTGGPDGINRSHYLGAVYGMERIMGRADSPVRKVLNYASDHFRLPCQIVYAMTVIGADTSGKLHIRGLFIGDDYECFRRASELSLKVNFKMLDKPLKKVVVYLDPHEFKSTWLGNKSIYRTRMAIADGGELIVLGPGVKEFGEDKEIDRLVRKYGYVGTPRVKEAVKKNEELRKNLSAAAHLIHGSSEGRFRITYCPGHLARKEVEGVGFEYGDLAAMNKLYPVQKWKDGFQSLPDGSEVFYISNPALGLWAHRGRFAVQGKTER